MRPPLDWTERGRELGASLSACHAVVVVGADPIATAEAALGIARRQAEERRVAVVDLLGDAPPLQSLVHSDDAHGIVDSFVFGVSLNKIAYPVEGAPNLFVMPSGSAPIDYEELLPNPRWGRLSGGFREVGALLVIVAPFDVPKLIDLVDHTDGLVIIGDSAPADVPVAQALAWLRPRRATAEEPAEAPLAKVASARPVRSRRWSIAGGAGIALSLLFVFLLWWFARRPFAGEKPVQHVSEAKPSAPAAAAILSETTQTFGASAPDTVRRDTATTPTDLFPVLTVANPGDSAKAAAWSVRLEQTNTPAAAIMDLRGRFEAVPVGTYGFEDLRTRFILLVAGAYDTRAGAESLLVQLRARGTLAPDNGSVIALPFAFMVQQDVPLAAVQQRLKLFAAAGRPVYALRQPTGAWHVYFGAYASPQHAALALPAVREAGLTPMLVYRIGRVN